MAQQLAETFVDPEWTFADRLRKARRHAGLSQRDMADVMGVPEKRYGSWEMGHTPRNLVEIAKAASTATSVRTEWLLGLSTSAYKSDEWSEGDETVPGSATERALSSVPCTPRRRSTDRPIQPPLVVAVS